MIYFGNVNYYQLLGNGNIFRGHVDILYFVALNLDLWIDPQINHQ